MLPLRQHECLLGLVSYLSHAEAVVRDLFSYIGKIMFTLSSTGRFLIHFTVGDSEPIKAFVNATTFLLIFVSSSCVHSELLAFYNFSVCIGLVFSQFLYAEWRYTHFGTPSKHLGKKNKGLRLYDDMGMPLCSMKASPKCAAYFKRMYGTTITIATTTTTTTTTTATTTITTKHPQGIYQFNADTSKVVQVCKKKTIKVNYFAIPNGHYLRHQEHQIDSSSLADSEAHLDQKQARCLLSVLDHATSDTLGNVQEYLCQSILVSESSDSITQ
uniref:Uncharacterized protein n=1 Tax=Glossina austeni TaxID=7395 RepID=A0A1A9VXL0_GLOAU